MVPTKTRPRPTPREPFCAATYCSITATCDDSCPFKHDEDGNAGGCFAESGFTGIMMRKLDEAANDTGIGATEVSAIEARELDSIWRRGIPQDGALGGRDLRLHVGGDVRTIAGALLLAASARRWKERGGGTVWTYTHSWRHIPREAWGSIQVLASVEDPADIARARERDYPAAIVVEEFPSERTFRLERTGDKVIPCPFDTRGVTCVECRLCLDRDLNKLGVSIGFAVHGPQAVTARDNLVRVNGDRP